MATFKLYMILGSQHSLMHRILEEAGIDASYFTSGRAERYREAQCELAKAELEANPDLVDTFLDMSEGREEKIILHPTFRLQMSNIMVIKLRQKVGPKSHTCMYYREIAHSKTKI